MFEVLLVEDHPTMSANIIDFLSDYYRVTPAYTLSEAECHLHASQYDLIILDLMLPDGSGLSLLKTLKPQFSTTGVIILSAKEALNDKLIAFELGAYDYLTKPFFMEELRVRMQLILKRMGKVDDQHSISFKNLKIDLNKCAVTIDDMPLDLNEKTYKLLEYFVTNKNILLFKEQIFDRICGIDSEASTDIVEVYMSRLRKQLSVYGYDKYLITRRGMGYILDEKTE